jgi:hypothetical protein
MPYVVRLEFNMEEAVMAGKLSFLAGLSAGYVLGARSGRERYDQIVAKAQQFWQDPRVQEKTGQAQQLAKDKGGAAAAVVAEKATETGTKVASTVKDKVQEKAGSGDGTTSAIAGSARATAGPSTGSGTSR